MSPNSHPDERVSLTELAQLLARGILRLHQRNLLVQQQIISESATQGLEVPAETVLTVHNG